MNCILLRGIAFIAVCCPQVGFSRGAEWTLGVVGIWPWEVVQRVDSKGELSDNELGYADVSLVCSAISIPNEPSVDPLVWEFRVLAFNVEVEQKKEVDSKEVVVQGWRSMERSLAHLEQEDNAQEAGNTRIARIPAGGWYRLEVRCLHGNDEMARHGIEPIGIGEVILIAGQSYATNCNDERLKVTDKASRVSAYNSATKTWAIANDPQPAPDGSDGGSIWPPVGDTLANDLGVPICFANVAVGATASSQWLPDTPLHQRLIQVGKELKRFRAVAWQQGESDVLAKTSTQQYVDNLAQIESSASTVWSFRPSWFLAKSTHHPTVYHDPEGESAIRSAIDELCKTVPFQYGPDTDLLQGENRGDMTTRRHFTGLGQTRAAKMWAQILKDAVSDGTANHR
jgi:hypothetical protein